MAAAAGDTVRLEGFAESIKGRRVFCAAGGHGAHGAKFVQAFLRGKVAALDAETVHRGRKVLVTQGVHGAPKWVAQMSWDASFHVRDVQDLKLALTYVQHAAKPTRLFWMGQEPAGAALQALGRVDGLTLVVIGGAAGPGAAGDWDAVFWGPEATFDEIEGFVGGRLGPARLPTLRAALKELRAAEVGLVWSSIGESDKRGELYWYDPADGHDLTVHVDPAEAADTLRAVADLLTK
jgi:hypothetical protein